MATAVGQLAGGRHAEAEAARPAGEALFVDSATYRWRAWDEVAVSAYWTGRYDEGLVAARRALAACPDDPRLQANVEWCERGLAAQREPVDG